MFRTVLVLAVVLALALSLAPTAAAQLPVGADAPDFTLLDLQGVSRSLSDHADQVVVLFFVGWG